MPPTVASFLQTQRTAALQREVQEDDGEMLINSHSYLPLSKLTKERWAKDETDLFYQILCSYGADFTFMAQCFKGRTRKQVRFITMHAIEAENRYRGR